MSSFPFPRITMPNLFYNEMSFIRSHLNLTRSEIETNWSVAVYFTSLFLVTSYISHCYPMLNFSKYTSRIQTEDFKASDHQHQHEKAGTQKRRHRRRMTSIGKFSLRSQTEENPSIISFFVVLTHNKGESITVREFDDLWRQRVMKKHERFSCQVSSNDDDYFEIAPKSMESYAREITRNHINLSKRVEHMLTSDLEVKQKLWEVELTTTKIGDTGVLREDRVNTLKKKYEYETIALFRVHHCLCDGVSLSVALGDVADEADKLNSKIQKELAKRRQAASNKTFEAKVVTFFKLFIFYVFGSIFALIIQSWRMANARSPFDKILANSTIPQGCRSISWRQLASIDEVKNIIKHVDKSATINDLGVVLTTAAVSKQIEEHAKNVDEPSRSALKCPSSAHVTIPVHLTGGILLPGQTLGNNIGAFVSNVPLSNTGNDNDRSVSRRLRKTSSQLKEGKQTPAPLIAWKIAKFVSENFPQNVAKFILRNGNAKSVAVISNVRGFPFKVHWLGRPVEFMSAFLPLPPGIPIGVCVQSYDGEITFTVTADKRAVPDADKFADWMIVEYQRLLKEVESKI